MAKFIKSKFKVLWGTIFSFFYGFFATDVIAQDAEDSSDADEESKKDIFEICIGISFSIIPPALSCVGLVCLNPLFMPSTKIVLFLGKTFNIFV